MPLLNAPPDALSNVLSLLRLRGEMVCVGECGSPWSLSFQEPQAHFHFVESGFAWLKLKNHKAIRLDAGDLAMIPLGAGHVLCSDPKLPAVAIETAVAAAKAREGFVYRFGGEGDKTNITCGRFSFSGVLAPKLLSVLPAVMQIEGRRGRPVEWLRITSHFLLEEASNPRPGSAIMIERLLDLLFIQAIRDWGSRSPKNLGWLGGLRDPSIGRALSAIHDAPARHWTVQSLAQISGISRSAFATRFASVVNQTPLKYLANWRLDLAANQLRSGSSTIGEIAASVGYGSEAALTRAFKAHFGTTPAAFRRGGTP